jgi:hypothetical protein
MVELNHDLRGFVAVKDVFAGTAPKNPTVSSLSIANDPALQISMQLKHQSSKDMRREALSLPPHKICRSCDITTPLLTCCTPSASRNLQ